MNLEQKIESILFYKNEPMEIKKLAAILGVSEKEIREGAENLSKSLENRGVCLIRTENELSLATAPQTTELIDKIAKDEMNREIGKAGLETLAIILYNGPVSRREIDYIRGVNSAFILRNLSIRGLIEREPDQKDQRILRYKSSLALLAHLGLRTVEEMPDFESIRKTIRDAERD